jgi:hypothetical protein
MPQGNALNLPLAALVPSKIIVRIGNVKIPLKDCSRASVAELQAGEILPCVAAAATDLDVCVPYERAKLVRAERKQRRCLPCFDERLWCCQRNVQRNPM